MPLIEDPSLAFGDVWVGARVESSTEGVVERHARKWGFKRTNLLEIISPLFSLRLPSKPDNKGLEVSIMVPGDTRHHRRSLGHVVSLLGDGWL